VPVEFLGKAIEVEVGEGEAPAPVAFRLGKTEHRVAEVLQRWEEQGSGQQIPGHQERRGYWPEAGARRGKNRPRMRPRSPSSQLTRIWLATKIEL